MSIRKAFVSLAVVLAAAGLVACGGASGSGTDKEGYSDTSTTKSRKEYLENELAEPRELKDGEQAIIIKMRPQFVLHLDDEDNVKEFEALNDEARSLKRETKSLWKKQHYSDAVDGIFERALIDGYISDNNPLIDIEVISDKKDKMTEQLRKTASERTNLHGVNAELELHEDED